jgi:hypothetical protein
MIKPALRLTSAIKISSGKIPVPYEEKDMRIAKNYAL